jgi:hypothetical protein
MKGNTAEFSPTLKVAPVRRFTLPLYAVTLFLSALLIFAIQPMFTKMVLPKLGGSPSAWSVAIVVKQLGAVRGRNRYRSGGPVTVPNPPRLRA